MTLSPAPTRLPPPSHVPSRHALCLRVRRRGVYPACVSARSHEKNLLFFASLCARQYPTVTATSHRGSSARFDGAIGHVIIDASLVPRRVATRGRGCRPQHVDLRQNKLMRGHIAPASTASSNAPTPILLARGHLILDDQPPMRAHCCGGGLCRRTREVITISIIIFIYYFLFYANPLLFHPSFSQPPHQAG